MERRPVVSEPKTVKDLIAKLSTYDQDSLVMVECEDHGHIVEDDDIEAGVAVLLSGKFYVPPRPGFAGATTDMPDRWGIEGYTSNNWPGKVLERRSCVIIR
jgi:hypothetical protein